MTECAKAFEDMLRSLRLPYVAVDEAKKSLFGQAKLQAFDFIVYAHEGPNPLIKVANRGDWARRDNWIAYDVIRGMQQWEKVFGEGFEAVFVFGYWVGHGREVPPESHTHAGRSWVFVQVPVAQYAQAARLKSVRWGTVGVARAEYTKVAQFF